MASSAVAGQPVLTGSVALVTGASRGIGKGCALALAKAGCTVYITGRTLESSKAYPGTLAGTAAEVAAAAKAAGNGGDCVGVVCDHARDDDTRAVFERVAADRGRLDILVNNACDLSKGPSKGEYWWERDTMEHYDAHTTVGLRSHYMCSMLAAQMMVGRKGGLIVSISSFGAMRRYTSIPYAIAKSSTDRMTRDMAEDLKPFGVTIVSMWPGLIKTERMLGPENPRAEKIRKSKAPESPEFVGRAVAALAGDGRSLAKTGKVVMSHELGVEYGFTDTDGNVPNDKVMKELRLEMAQPPRYWVPDWEGYRPTSKL